MSGTIILEPKPETIIAEVTSKRVSGLRDEVRGRPGQVSSVSGAIILEEAGREADSLLSDAVHAGELSHAEHGPALDAVRSELSKIALAVVAQEEELRVADQEEEESVSNRQNPGIRLAEDTQRAEDARRPYTSIAKERSKAA